MVFRVLPPTADLFRLQPVDQCYAPMFCFGLVTVSCALASFAFACATPVAAFAVVAAATLRLRPALLVMTGAWLVNQTIGFGLLHYPVDGNTIAWGFLIGAAALGATAATSAALRALPQNRTALVLALAFVCAYAAYELILFTATPFLGRQGAFTFEIVTRIGLRSAGWLIGLVAVCEIVRLLNPLGSGRTFST
ncbi:hypothetical protein [Bradyrhizobium sp. Arg816]|uniref:hypothetical protein n=1 Tax=Bradyrhizobium sp. Arg816 TaxID=2998491 RepID=UPI00249EED38|nr:hypothetical protein [Bradyrhizobium sp. Arg816]MDI3563409.1 hypothetical protein [Bradyrhizobium sp. Arg816]